MSAVDKNLYVSMFWERAVAALSAANILLNWWKSERKYEKQFKAVAWMLCCSSSSAIDCCLFALRLSAPFLGRIEHWIDLQYVAVPPFPQYPSHLSLATIVCLRSLYHLPFKWSLAPLHLFTIRYGTLPGQVGHEEWTDKNLPKNRTNLWMLCGTFSKKRD